MLDEVQKVTADHFAWVDSLDQTINRSAGVNLAEELAENGHVVIARIQVAKPSSQVMMVNAVEVRGDIKLSRELEPSASFRSCFLEIAIIIRWRCENSPGKRVPEASSRC